MTNMNHDGIYYYDLTIPVAQGVYPAIAKCYYTAGQDKRVAQSYVLNTGVLEGGTINDTWVQDLVYLKLKTVNTNGGRVNATFNFSDYYNACGNVSELLMTGLTIYWRGEWNTATVNHDIVLYVFNYTSNSWVTLSNKILGGSGATDFEVSNSLAMTNITKLLGVTSTKSLLLRATDTTNAEKDKKFWTDYLYASCDQLSSPNWQEVKGSSELHVTSSTKYSYTDENSLYTINNTQVTILANGSVITEQYYAGIFKHNFQISSGISSPTTVSIEWQGLHSIPCNSVISFFYINATGYYPYPYTTQRQTTEDHCSVNFNLNLAIGETYDFEVHARNVWESDLRSTASGLGSIYPLLDGGCTLWRIVKGLPVYTVPKNETYTQYNYYYQACSNFYDDFYWFNKTFQQSLIDKPLIVDRITYLQYEADFSSVKFAEDKLNVVTNYLLQNLQSVNDYSQLLIANPLGDSVVNTTDQRYWANQSTLYQAWKIVNDSCGTGTCKINGTDIALNVWNSPSRNLTYTPPISVNATEISDAVWASNRTVSSSLLSQFTTSFWNYTGTINPLILSQITVATTNAIWNYSSTISSNILTQISNSVWNSPNRNLTFYNNTQQVDMTDYNKIQTMVWNATNRNLTFYEVTTINYNTMALNVWNSTNRNLTYYPAQTDMTNYSLIASTVWNFMNRNLTFTQDVTDYNKIQIVVWNATARNLTYYELSNLSAGDIWNYASRNLTYTPDMTNYNAIWAGVWNYTTRNLTWYEVNNITAQNIWTYTNRSLTEFNFVVNALVNVTEIAQSVWTYNNRSLTFYQVNNITTADIWSYINRTLTDYNQTAQTDLTNYNKIQTMVWNATDRNLTFYPAQVDMTNYNKIQEMTWNATNRNLTYYEVTQVNETSIALQVWQSNNRTLTYYQINNITPQDIWTYSNRSLTEFNFVVNANVNVSEISQAVWTYNNRSLTFYEVNNITPQDVWSYVNRTLTDYNQSSQVDLTNYDKIQMMVWNATDRNLTYYPSQIDMTNYTLMAETNWNYANRTLTYYEVTQVNATDIAIQVWQNNNRTLTYYQINNITADDIWNYNNRTLTDFNFTVTANVNESAIANVVWNYGGAIGTNILSQFTNDIWNYSSTVSSNILDQIAVKIWNSPDRNLTWYNMTDLTDYNKIQVMVWNATDRNLTYYQVNNVTAEEIWSYVNRTLTDYNQTDLTDYNKIQTIVWNATIRTLTDFNFTVNVNESLIAEAVWNAVNRTLSDYNQSDLTDYNKIQQMVWNATTRTLTDFNFTVETTVNNTAIADSIWSSPNRTLTDYNQSDLTDYALIQQMVWNATTRSLTEFNFTVDVNQSQIAQAVWEAVNRTLSDYNQTDLTNYDKIQAMVWNATSRTLTDFNFTVNVDLNNVTVNATVDSNAIAGAVWNYTNKTVDFATTGSTSNVSLVENIKDIGQVYLGGTEYIDGDNGKVVIRLVRGTGSLAEIETGATCRVSITYPDQSYLVANASMTELGEGVYYYDFTVPAGVGVYTYYSTCNISDRHYFGLETFHVYNVNQSSESVWNYPNRNLTYTDKTTPDEIWNYPVRNLTYYEVANVTNLTVNINNDAVAQAVWNYNGTINPSLLDQFTNSIECLFDKYYENTWGVNLDC
jgi:hypothetical protein